MSKLTLVSFAKTIVNFSLKKCNENLFSNFSTKRSTPDNEALLRGLNAMQLVLNPVWLEDHWDEV